ncbi:MAG: hypothetical protein JJU30_01955 [Alkalimonas sp.]|nr:hypothetical protein [Alkalimonas sp.]
MALYEGKVEAPISASLFVKRLLLHGLAVIGLLAGSLALGVLGYILTEGLELVDAFLNAAMLLAGMGPVHPPMTVEGKIFAGCYALYSGLVFIVTAALLLTPVVHRIMHRFHWEPE